MGAALPVILQGILAAIQAAPQVAEIVTAAKNMISALFTAKVITTDQQTALHTWVDNQVALAASGIVPPAWQVQPDPTT